MADRKRVSDSLSVCVYVRYTISAVLIVSACRLIPLKVLLSHNQSIYCRGGWPPDSTTFLIVIRAGKRRRPRLGRLLNKPLDNASAGRGQWQVCRPQNNGLRDEVVMGEHHKNTRLPSWCCVLIGRCSKCIYFQVER